MGIEIRQAKKQDLNKMLNVIESYPFAKKWDKPLAEKYYKSKFNKKCNCFKEDKIFVGTVDNKIVAVVGYCPDRLETKRSYWLGWFYVHSKYQNKKYGRKLLKYVFNELKGTEAEKLFVDTSSNRFYRKAVKIYLDNGFNLEATLRDYYGKGEDQIIFGREL